MPLVKTDQQPPTSDLQDKPAQPKDAKGNWLPPTTHTNQPKPWQPPAYLKIPEKKSGQKNPSLNTSMLPSAEEKAAREKTAVIMQQKAEEKKKAGRPKKV
jgi:hypothetical protein